MRQSWWRAAALLSLLGSAGSAHAFDCSRASTTSEKAICSDATARAADDDMAKAFASRLSDTPPALKPTLLAAQNAWLKDRDNACAQTKGEKLSRCLADQSAERRAFLAGEPEAGAGAPGRLAPDFRIEKGAKGRAALNIQILRYPSPTTAAERAFNAAVDQLIGPLDQPEKDDPAADRYEYDRSMRLTYASPRLISAYIEGYNDTGGAHPTSFTGGVNIDVEHGRPATFADLADESGARTIFAYCLKEAVAQKKERMGEEAPLSKSDLEELRTNLEKETARLESWRFTGDKAIVSYDPYAIGAYAEGPYECDIPYSTLKPLVRSSFPLP